MVFVSNILKENGIEPAYERSKRTPWRVFLKAHWETLIRARAIENLAYMIAPAQSGLHVNGRETYGNSMIVDPWGVVLDRLPHGSGVVLANINHGYQTSVRNSLPALKHRTLHFC